MGGSSRNAPCPCGSGRKHKLCCMAREQRTATAARLADGVYSRLQDWSRRVLPDELERALGEFCDGDAGRALTDGEIDIFCAWFHLDRKLPGGETPVARYAAEARLSAPEREVLAALAEAPLGLHRALAVDHGRELELEDVLLGTTARCRSPHVSTDVVRWDLVLCRVTREGPGHGLFGPARIFGPSDEDELRAELAQHSGGPLDADPSTVEALFRRCGSDLLRFVPPSSRAEPSFFSVEGHPAVHAEAAWRVDDHIPVGDALEAVPDLLPLGPDGEGGESVEWVADRRAIAELREELPLGAICLEATPVTFDDHGFSVPDGGVGVGTFELRSGELTFSALSEQRLDAALRLVRAQLGTAAELERRELTPLKSSRAQRPTEAPEPSGLSELETAVVEARLFEHRYRGWVDEPNPALGGATPRAAATEPGRRAQVESLVRRIENGAERSCRGRVAPDLGWLRDELGLEAHPSRARRAA